MWYMFASHKKAPVEDGAVTTNVSRVFFVNPVVATLSAPFMYVPAAVAFTATL